MIYFLSVSVHHYNVTWPIFCPFQCTLTMWNVLFSVRFSALRLCDMTNYVVCFSAPWQGDMTYFLSVSVHPDNVTCPNFCPFQCSQTMWHDLFSVRFSAPWQCDITYLWQCDMTYFLSVSVHPDNVTWPIFCPFQSTLTMWHDLLSVCFIDPWQCGMPYFLSASVPPDNMSWPLFCLFQCPMPM